jgi:2-polyprenyl-6-methoxyphenol hydroxylase-like FAD-dependent oxidoreductase
MHGLIIGSGIAGPVTAMALQRVGIEATIFEAYPPPDAEVGSYLTITPNGIDALAAIQAAALATGSGFPTRRNVMWNHSGRRWAALPLDSTLAGSPYAHTIKRSLLAANLQEEARRRGVPIEYGRRLQGARMASGGEVVATFEDGTSVTGDFLIGADGVHSVVRPVIDPSAPSARYVGLTNFGGITRGAAGDLEAEEWHLMFGRRGFFGYTATPGGDVIWFVNYPRPQISLEERQSTSNDEWKATLADLFTTDAGPAVELIRNGELELAADSTHDLGHVPVWHRDSMIVIGDAAHAPAPSSGQGASMAIEDGITLAVTLRDERSVGQAFVRYEAERRERVEKIVAWGARSSSSKTPGPVGRAMRDLFMGVAFKYMVTEKSLSWMYDYRVSLEQSAPAA